MCVCAQIEVRVCAPPLDRTVDALEILHSPKAQKNFWKVCALGAFARRGAPRRICLPRPASAHVLVVRTFLCNYKKVRTIRLRTSATRPHSSTPEANRVRTQGAANARDWPLRPPEGFCATPLAGAEAPVNPKVDHSEWFEILEDSQSYYRENV